MKHICLNDLSVGYDNTVVVENINIEFIKGKMTCILGSNGSGKTTVLKTIAGIISKIGGVVEIAGTDLNKYKQGDLAKEMSVVLTNRIEISSMTGFDVASMGRYPHTGFFGVLSNEDISVVYKCLEDCGATYLRNKPFDQMSDGEKQKILISRGLAQAPSVILLDEPTSHLDIKYKIDVLTTLKKLCVNDRKTVICTLHEPDLAIKCCDYLVLVKDDKILSFGNTDEVVSSGKIDELYGFEHNQFSSEIGIVEFNAAKSKDIFIIGTDENTTAVFRSLNRQMVGFAAGVLHKNDVNYHIAKTMNIVTIATEAYSAITDADIDKAFEIAKHYDHIFVSDFIRCDINHKNVELAQRLQCVGKDIVFLNNENATSMVYNHSIKR